jgi:outer membrane receptor protein involved in Fe transport
MNYQTKKFSLYFSILRTTLLALLAVAFSGILYAQDDPDEVTGAQDSAAEARAEAQADARADALVNEDAPVEEVYVTGSRIPRTNETSPIPLQVFDAADLEVSGTDDLAEAVIQLPGVSPSISPQSSNNLIQTSGLSTISLRRLGDDRTLVLINGKRAVSNSGNADRVSISTLPVGFVKRTEVTTGGASAIYGSDAIAGVANFILRDEFEGLRVDARTSTPDASGGDESRLNILFGTNYGDGGNVLFGLTYRDEDIIRADSTRPESVLALQFDDPSFGSNDLFAEEWLEPGCQATPVGNDRHCLLPDFSTLPGGTFEGDAWFSHRDQRWYNDKSLHPEGRPFAGSSTST